MNESIDLKRNLPIGMICQRDEDRKQWQVVGHDPTPGRERVTVQLVLRYDDDGNPVLDPAEHFWSPRALLNTTRRVGIANQTKPSVPIDLKRDLPIGSIWQCDKHQWQIVGHDLTLIPSRVMVQRVLRYDKGKPVLEEPRQSWHCESLLGEISFVTRPFRIDDFTQKEPNTMPCPTCGETFTKIAATKEELNVWLCPRCGTVKVEDAVKLAADTYVPKLVDRCRKFQGKLIETMSKGIQPGDLDTRLPEIGMRWSGLGIAEAINVPGQRVGEY